MSSKITCPNMTNTFVIRYKRETIELNINELHKYRDEIALFIEFLKAESDFVSALIKYYEVRTQ